MRIVWLICFIATGLLPHLAVADEPVKPSRALPPSGVAESLFPELVGTPPVIQPAQYTATADATGPTVAPESIPPLPPHAFEPTPAPYEAYGSYGDVVPPVVPPPMDMPAACPHCGPHGDCRRCDPHCEPWYRLFDFGLHADPCGDAGIGQERVMLAPFFLGVSQPFTNVRVEYESVAGMATPDRSEYLWAAPPKGPEIPETETDYLDLRLVSELAPGDSFSITTSLPLRSLDPEVNPNTTGFGDMSVTTKLVLVDGNYWQFTQLLTTDINTGSARKGLGNGHVSLEPGILGRYEWNPRLYFHGRLAFWVPLGGDPDYSGPAVNYGWGASYVAYETDTFAAIPTFELLGWTFLDGMKTMPNGYVAGVDGESSIAVLPGTRFVLGPAGDLGLFEVGLAGGFSFGDEGWYDSIFRTELRWSF